MQHRGVSFESTSTATIRATSEYTIRNTSEDEMGTDPEPRSNEARFIIATDFGTTFSAVAWLDRAAGHPLESTLITNYDDDPLEFGTHHPNFQVPTESWYIQDHAETVEDQKIEETEDIYEDSDRGVTPEAEYFVHDMMELDTENTPDEPATFEWGYSIGKLISPDMNRDRFNRIARAKLLLDKSPHTQHIRDELRPILQRLKNSKIDRKRIIERDEDVIADYLTQLFRHTKRELKKSGIPGDSEFEHVLCVPAIWGAEACREMENAAAIAIQKSGLGSMDDFFLVSEPEAAAAFVLAKQRDELNAGDLFLLLDAGGGTVDATTYKVTERFPLRLSKEIVHADGCLNGSSFVNAAFREHLRKRLEGVRRDIETNNYTLDGILDDLVNDFEQRLKWNINLHEKPFMERLGIKGLRPSERRRFEANKVLIDKRDFEKIFNPSLIAISKLMEDQLSSAKLVGSEVEKVILVGGFSASKPLRILLEKKLSALSSEYGYRISLIVPRNAQQTAVVQGAIIRAWDKEKGPERFLRLSYGLQVTEEYDPDMYEPHRLVVKCATLDRRDGRRYVHNTIDWLVCKDDNVPVPDRIERSTVVYHLFDASAKKLECEEILWVSATCTESHYRKQDEPNKTHAHIAGRIVADMTPLRKKGLIKPIQPEKGSKMRRYYKVEIRLVIIIEGRNLRFEARWPIGEDGRKMAEGQVSIAAAFRPGTK